MEFNINVDSLTRKRIYQPINFAIFVLYIVLVVVLGRYKLTGSNYILILVGVLFLSNFVLVFLKKFTLTLEDNTLIIKGQFPFLYTKIKKENIEQIIAMDSIVKPAFSLIKGVKVDQTPVRNLLIKLKGVGKRMVQITGAEGTDIDMVKSYLISAGWEITEAKNDSNLKNLYKYDVQDKTGNQ